MQAPNSIPPDAPTPSSNILRFSFVTTNSSSSSRSRRHRHRARAANRRGDNQLSSASTSSASSSDTSDLFAGTAPNGGHGKRRERNLLAACCAVFSIAVLCVSLVETRWFYLSGGGCNVNYIGVGHFFAPGRLESQLEYNKATKNEIVVYTFVLPSGLGRILIGVGIQVAGL